MYSYAKAVAGYAIMIMMSKRDINMILLSGLMC